MSHTHAYKCTFVRTRTGIPIRQQASTLVCSRFSPRTHSRIHTRTHKYTLAYSLTHPLSISLSFVRALSLFLSHSHSLSLARSPFACARFLALALARAFSLRERQGNEADGTGSDRDDGNALDVGVTLLTAGLALSAIAHELRNLLHPADVHCTF